MLHADVPANPCADPARQLICPNLRMAPPRGFREVTRNGRRLLLMANRIVNVGPGPLELRGRRTAPYEMPARQIVARGGGLGRASLQTTAHLTWKYVDAYRGAYWKMADAARFELWAVDATGRRTTRVRTGAKLDYCLRDLFRRAGTHTGARPAYPACSQKLSRRTDTLGISVDWADGYPRTYPENWIDVTGLAGCFVVLQRADPLNGIFETDEHDNTATRVTRLPYRPGPQGCPRYAGPAA
ncbi:MAG: lysyl oxidase family protein [Solirubrobacteraceae bacterium]